MKSSTRTFPMLFLKNAEKVSEHIHIFTWIIIYLCFPSFLLNKENVGFTVLNTYWIQKSPFTVCYIKKVRICSFFCSVFLRIRSENGDFAEEISSLFFLQGLKVLFNKVLDQQSEILLNLTLCHAALTFTRN